MNEKEHERKIKELAEREGEIRSFSEVWADIAPVIEQTKPDVKKKKPVKWIYTLATCAACLVIICSVGLPLILGGGGQDVLPTIPPSDTTTDTVEGEGQGAEEGVGKEEIVYYYDDLIFEKLNDNKELFHEQINSSGVGVVTLQRYDDSSDYGLYKTSGGTVKGGKLNFNYSVGAFSYMVTMQFASSDVKNEDENILAGQNYENSGAVAQYKLTSSQEVAPGIILNSFVANASFNSVNYTLKIKTNATDLTEFFNDFFVL